PVSAASEEAQKFIDQGVGQLHGFWYFEAERSFRQAAALDPDCAMAYWGMAMANTNNARRAKEFLAEAVKRKSGLSPRETKYIDALDAWHKADAKKKKERAESYIKTLERLLYDHPEDLEAKAFLGLALWQNRDSGVPIASYLAVEALLKDVLEAEPLHPCHHYLIHLWDSEKPERALESAARCGPAAPAIAHMWHMPGHIYSRLKRYSDAAWQQEASARVDHAHMMRDRVLPDQIHNFAHNNEWLIRNLIHVGRARDAVELAKNMIELPRHPKYNTLKKGSAQFGRERLLQALAAFELWDELLALADTSYLEPTDDEGEQVKRLRHVGRALFRKGDDANGRARLADLEERLSRLEAERDKAVADAVERARSEARRRTPQVSEFSDAEWREHVERTSATSREQAQKDAGKPFSSRINPLRQAVDELRGHVAVAEGRHKEARDLFKKAGGVDALFLQRVQFLAGERDAAEKAAAKHVNSHKHETLPLAHLVDLRWQLGQRAEAESAFAELRELSGPLDLSAPPFARLTPIARELGWPDDWRVHTPRPNDFGERPDLASLGPFRWHPSPAEPWTLSEFEGHEHSLSDYHGRPVIVIFTLGHGCLHCAQQLQAFAPRTDAFAAAGISLLAISTDDRPSLKKSLDDYGSEGFPFPLVSDAALEVFKTYRAFDDFENQPLHGTFLIDAEGLVRWQDISYEPFDKVDFLLAEARRLLALSGPAPSRTAVATADAGAVEASAPVEAGEPPDASPGTR
ncbi:MAG TPA: redoxin domain-containing protein, partial [Planctomycetaceae bacterium]|nr:redoxin domain-containing protein [Planctomycetaceae bacterium]